MARLCCCLVLVALSVIGQSVQGRGPSDFGRALPQHFGAGGFDPNRHVLRRPEPIPSGRYLAERISRHCGGSRWSKIVTIARLARVSVLRDDGSVKAQWTERVLMARCPCGTRLVETIERDGTTRSFGQNGTKHWATVDDRPVRDPATLEEGSRRLRELDFWIRFPFSLRDRGVGLHVSGWDFIDAIPVWLLDVVPAKHGDGWPLSPIRLAINQNNYEIEAIVYPRQHGQTAPFSARTTNQVTIAGLRLPHLRVVWDQDGPIAREEILERIYNRPMPQAWFTEPSFEHY